MARIANFARVSNSTTATATTAEESLRLAFEGGNKVPANFLPTWVKIETETTAPAPKARKNRALKAAKIVETAPCLCGRFTDGEIVCDAKVGTAGLFAAGHEESLISRLVEGSEWMDTTTDEIVSAEYVAGFMGFEWVDVDATV